jgi:hypothetical protein
MTFKYPQIFGGSNIWDNFNCGTLAPFYKNAKVTEFNYKRKYRKENGENKLKPSLSYPPPGQGPSPPHLLGHQPT